MGSRPSRESGMWSLSWILLMNYSNISQTVQTKEDGQAIPGMCFSVVHGSTELACTTQRHPPQSTPVLCLITTYQIQLWSSWLLIEHFIWQANITDSTHYGMEINFNMNLSKHDKSFLLQLSFLLFYFCSVASGVPILKTNYNVREALPASVAFLQPCQEVVSPAVWGSG